MLILKLQLCLESHKFNYEIYRKWKSHNKGLNVTVFEYTTPLFSLHPTQI